MNDENGKVIIASVRTFGDVIHTFVERTHYFGYFMPGFVKHPKNEILNNILPPIKFEQVDHIVGA